LLARGKIVKFTSSEKKTTFTIYSKYLFHIQGQIEFRVTKKWLGAVENY
jgi:hypothetical protein